MWYNRYTWYFTSFEKRKKNSFRGIDYLQKQKQNISS